MKRYFFRLLIVLSGLMLAIILLSIFAPDPAVAPSTLHPLSLRSDNGQDIALQVERADTDSERAYGLMNRTHLENGMLFVFDEEAPLSFWMKNTLIPLDIVYFDANGNFVSSTSMLPCTADPCAQYPSATPAKYALEMSAGFLQQQGLNKDWKMSLQ